MDGGHAMFRRLLVTAALVGLIGLGEARAAVTFYVGTVTNPNAAFENNLGARTVLGFEDFGDSLTPNALIPGDGGACVNSPLSFGVANNSPGAPCSNAAKDVFTSGLSVQGLLIQNNTNLVGNSDTPAHSGIGGLFAYAGSSGNPDYRIGTNHAFESLDIMFGSEPTAVSLSPMYFADNSPTSDIRVRVYDTNNLLIGEHFMGGALTSSVPRLLVGIISDTRIGRINIWTADLGSPYIRLDNVTVYADAPEPSTFILLSVGLALVGLRRRRRFRS